MKFAKWPLFFFAPAQFFPSASPHEAQQLLPYLVRRGQEPHGAPLGALQEAALPLNFFGLDGFVGMSTHVYSA